VGINMNWWVNIALDNKTLNTLSINMSSNIPIHKTASMLHILVHIMDKEVDKSLTHSLGVSFAQFFILAHIHNCDQSLKNQVSLAKIMDITQPAISRHIKIMMDKDWVITAINPTNRRENILQLTPIGENIYCQSLDHVNQMCQDLFEHISPKDQQDLQTIISKLLIKFDYEF
jgi:DNA-binding MarR family transcriptional regulator